jgi:hypothetical protein
MILTQKRHLNLQSIVMNFRSLIVPLVTVNRGHIATCMVTTLHRHLNLQSLVVCFQNLVSDPNYAFARTGESMSVSVMLLALST